jgi:hypothetical protein
MVGWLYLEGDAWSGWRRGESLRSRQVTGGRGTREIGQVGQRHAWVALRCRSGARRETVQPQADPARWEPRRRPPVGRCQEQAELVTPPLSGIDWFCA